MSDVSLFEFNPDTGGLEYVPTEEELGEESVNNESGNVVDASGSEGSILSGEAENSVSVPTDEFPVLDSGSGSSGTVSLPVPLAESLLASSPAAGSLSSSTIDYFDRLVSGLDSDYIYVAYRNDVDDSYAGRILYGDNYDISGDTVIFGKGSVAVDVSRRSQSGYNNYINYDTSSADGLSVQLVDNSSILYYTNAFDGYPVLGGYERSIGFPALVAALLVAVFASVVLGRLFDRR